LPYSESIFGVKVDLLEGKIKFLLAKLEKDHIPLQ